MECIDHQSPAQALQRLDQSWGELLGHSRAGLAFNQPGWLSAWQETLGRNDKPHVLSVADAQGLAGLLPLCLAAAPAKEGGGRRLQFMGGRRADYHDAELAPGREDEALAALGKGLLPLLGRAGWAVFHHLPQGSHLLAWLRRKLPAWGWVCSEEVQTSPYLHLDRPWSEIESAWPKNHRGDLRRQRRRLEKQGALSFDVAARPEEAHAWLPEFFLMHSRAFAAAGRPGGIGRDPGMQAFLAQLPKILGCAPAGGMVHFSRLLLDGRPISMHYGFICRGRYYYYLPTYDPQWHNYSPGKVHLRELIAQGAENPAWRVFDFLLGAEQYKYRWTSQEQKVVTLAAAPRRSLGRARLWWLHQAKPRLARLREARR